MNIDWSAVEILIIWTEVLAVIFLIACVVERIFYKPPKDETRFFMREHKK